MVASSHFGWATLGLAALALGLSVMSLVVKALVVSEIRAATERVVAGRLRRAREDLDLDDPEVAAEFLAEWQAELATLSDRPVSALAVAIRLQRGVRRREDRS